MTIKDQIIAGSKMGYAAKIKGIAHYENEEMLVVGINTEKNKMAFKDENGRVVTYGMSEIDYCYPTIRDIRIVSLIYVGYLFGEPVIPDGQRFRVKATGDVYSLTGLDDKKWLEFRNETIFIFHPFEVEPYFD